MTETSGGESDPDFAELKHLRKGDGLRSSERLRSNAPGLYARIPLPAVDEPIMPGAEAELKLGLLCDEIRNYCSKRDGDYRRAIAGILAVEVDDHFFSGNLTSRRAQVAISKALENRYLNELLNHLQANFLTSPTSPLPAVPGGQSELSLEPGEEADVLDLREVPHKLTVVTSHNGVGLGQSLRKYCTYLESEGRPLPAILYLEDEIITAARQYEEFLPPSAGNTLSVLQRVHCLPRPILRHVWRLALDAIWPKIADALETSDVILKTHATWYHEESSSISPAANLVALSDRVRQEDPDSTLGRALACVKVITLIDDVYDCFVRLSESQYATDGPLFSPTMSFKETNLPHRSTIVRTILEWRQQEVRAAEQIARVLDAHLVLFPVKHPLQTFDRLVSRSTLCSISHPVALPRRLGIDGAGARLRDATDEVISALHKHEEFALVEPMSIDEHRFDVMTDENTERAVVSSVRLLPRWRSYRNLFHIRDTLLWDALAEDSLEVAEQPFVHLDRAPWNLWPPESCQTLEHVRYETRRQALWRVRLTLNEANDTLFVLRPFPDGRIRPSVRDEMTLAQILDRYHRARNRLDGVRRAAGRERRVIIWHPAEDERERMIDAIATVFGVKGGAWLRLLAGQGSQDRLRELCNDGLLSSVEEWVAENGNDIKLYSNFCRALDNAEIPYQATGSERVTVRQVANLLRGCVLGDFRSEPGLSPLLQTWDRSDLSAADWLDVDVASITNHGAQIADAVLRRRATQAVLDPQ